MARRQQTRGACAYCKKSMTRGGMSKHLASCEERQKAIEAAKMGKSIHTATATEDQSLW